jgi:hypothetical protein
VEIATVALAIGQVKTVHALALLPTAAALNVDVHAVENAVQSASDPVPADADPPAGVLEMLATEH